MPLVDSKFSNFRSGGQIVVGDIVVGLRGGLNTQFTVTGDLPVGTVVPIDNGGTGATTASGARVNLGLVIGTDVEAWSATLDGLAALDSTGLMVQTGTTTFVDRTLTGTSNQIDVANGSGVSQSRSDIELVIALLEVFSMPPKVNVPGRTNVDETVKIGLPETPEPFATSI